MATFVISLVLISQLQLYNKRGDTPKAEGMCALPLFGCVVVCVGTGYYGPGSECHHQYVMLALLSGMFIYKHCQEVETCHPFLFMLIVRTNVRSKCKCKLDPSQIWQPSGKTNTYLVMWFGLNCSSVRRVWLFYKGGLQELYQHTPSNQLKVYWKWWPNALFSKRYFSIPLCWDSE